ncbi:DUF927 domain-containing protein [Rhizobium ruizarguesonis]|jgi:hypothetical protein
MALDFSLKIQSGLRCEGASGSYCLITATALNGDEIQLTMPSDEVALDVTKVTRELMKAGLGLKCDSKLIRAEVDKARKEATVSSKNIAVTTGWHDQNFVWNGRVLGSVNETDLICASELREKAYHYPRKKDRRLIDFISEHGPLSDVLALAVMAAYSPPLLGTLSHSERPLIHIWGDSKTGKTSLLAAVNALVKTPNRRDLYPFAFTPRALEEDLLDCNDGILCLDETSTVSKEEVNKTIGELIYIASNGRGKRRSKISQLPDLQWRSIVFVTGEYSLDTLTTRKRGSGQDARLITLPVRSTKEGGIFNRGDLSAAELADKCRILTELAEAYTGDEYQRWVKKIVATGRPTLRGRVQQSIDRYVAKLVDENASNLTRTLAAKFAAFAVTGDGLMAADIVDWPRGFPFEVAKRAFEADLAAKNPEPGILPLQRRTIAQKILARLYADRLHTRAPRGVHVRTENGQERLIIPKGASATWLGEDEKQLYAALQSHGGLLHGRNGKNCYAQLLFDGSKRQSAMNIDLPQLIAEAFPIHA